MKKPFLTEYFIWGVRYADCIWAETWAEADSIAIDRDRGEHIKAELVRALDMDRFHESDYPRVMAALVEQNYSTVH